MWSNIILNGNNKPNEDNYFTKANSHPPSRYKHSCVLVPVSGNNGNGNSCSEEASSTSSSDGTNNKNYDLYLYGGRSGTFPLKDFWKLDLRLGKWEEIKPTSNGGGGGGDDCWPSHLQEHSMVYFDRKIYVFGGEISFSYGEDSSPLWIYDLDTKIWRRWGLQAPEEKGTSKLRQIKSPDLSRQTKTPLGRRGHSAVVWNNYMLIYGGYRDLKGSLGDLWAFHFDSESWHLFSSPELSKKDSRPWYFFSSPGSFSSSSSSSLPCPRHSHISVLHNSALYIHGGMQDLIELQDLWKFCLKTRKWTQIKAKNGPGPLHRHVGVTALDSLLIMSGERAGKSVDEFWRFDFLSEEWERIVLNGCRPCPRICAWGGMLPMVMKRVDVRSTGNKNPNNPNGSHYKRYPGGQFDDLEHLEVASSSTDNNDSNDGTKYWWDYDESEHNYSDTQSTSAILHEATNKTAIQNIQSNVQIHVTNAPSTSNEPQQQPVRKTSLFSELARFPFTSGGSGGDYQALSESNSVCLSEEETSPRPDAKDRGKWKIDCPPEEEIQFEPICPQIPGQFQTEGDKPTRQEHVLHHEPLIDLGESMNSPHGPSGHSSLSTKPEDSSPEEDLSFKSSSGAAAAAIVLEGSSSLITFDTPVSSRAIKYTTNNAASSVSSTVQQQCSSGVGIRPLSASASSTRRSESANCLQLTSQRAGSAGSSRQSVKKSSSVRFADMDESGRKTTNGNGRNGVNENGAHSNGGGGGHYSRSSSQHQLVLMRECTSDYSSMDNGLNYNQHQQQQQQRNNGNCSASGFENPNYRGSGSSMLFSTNGQSSSNAQVECYEMGNMNVPAIPVTKNGPSKSKESSPNEPPNEYSTSNGTERNVNDCEEDTRRPYYFEVSTPNYMLLIGGNESHSSQVVSKKQPLSIWRLRVTSELFSTTNPFSPVQNSYSSRGIMSGIPKTGGETNYPTYSNSVLSNSNSINRSMMKVNLSGPNHTTGF